MQQVLRWLLIALALSCANPGPAVAATAEKFAVLVGVDAQKSAAVTTLRGPGNDVRLMRDLLVKTYGFKNDAEHIVELRGKDATVVGIRDAFRRQLIDKAKAEKAKGAPAPVVVFYFSGHGSVITDHNNDEGDGIDETLVAYDSRAAGGVDIVDDEIDKWFDELRSATTNVTFILDSCHSGTATRAQDKVARELPPNPNMGGVVRARTVADPVAPNLLKALQFTAVAGALASELSYEGDDIPGAKKVWHGYLTWNLVQTLRLRPDLTWRQALVLVRLNMAQIAPGQHPQVEGDIDRPAFGGFDEQAQPYISVEAVSPDGKTLTIGAGVPNGLGEGSIVAIYDATAKSLRESDKRLATAKVTKTGLAQSQAVIVEGDAPTIPLDAKAVILSVSAGKSAPTLKIDALPNQTTSDADRDLLAKVAKDPIVAELATGDRLKLVTGSADYLYAVQRGCRDAKGALVTVDRGEPAAGCKAAYYIATRQNRRPLFAYHVAADDPDVVRRLADAVDRLENQADLRSQVNNASRLGVKLTLLDIGKDAAGNPSFVPHTDNGVTALKVGQTYTFEITNTSPRDVYVTFLVVGTSGAVIPVIASASGDLLKQGVTMRVPLTFTAGEPYGLETYKVFAATSPSMNFRHWVRTGLTARDPGMTEGAEVDEWVTAQMDIQIEAAR